MSELENLREYYPLVLATKRLECDEFDLLAMAQAGDITFYQYPDPTLGLIEWEPVNRVDIGTLISEGTKTGRKYQGYTADFDTRRSDLVLPREEMLKAHQLLNPSRYYPASGDKPPSAKTVNNLARVLKALIHIHYGADVAENPRKFLDDPNSQLSIDFANKGLEAPGGKALEKHLKTILIEALPTLEKVDVKKITDE